MYKNSIPFRPVYDEVAPSFGRKYINEGKENFDCSNDIMHDTQTFESNSEIDENEDLLDESEEFYTDWLDSECSSESDTEYGDTTEDDDGGE